MSQVARCSVAQTFMSELASLVSFNDGVAGFLAMRRKSMSNVQKSHAVHWSAGGLITGGNDLPSAMNFMETEFTQ